jgi:hypothetical protein
MMLMGETPCPTKLVLLGQSSPLSSSYKKTIMVRKYSLSKVHVDVEARQAQFLASQISQQHHRQANCTPFSTSFSVGLDPNLDHEDALVESLRSGNASARRRGALLDDMVVGFERPAGAVVHMQRGEDDMQRYRRGGCGLRRAPAPS